MEYQHLKREVMLLKTDEYMALVARKEFIQHLNT
ncbi:hypothetical protein J2Y03_001164 [Neobacillus niacini]|nr:hypothetical protein [Neobacillus niacini]